MKPSKIAYKPVGFALGALSGMIAGAAFKQTWKLIEGEGDAPDALDEDRPWGQILLAAAVQGAIFAVVKAAVERSGAQATRRVTGTWPA
ncbi:MULTISPECIES: DUF4235 domain-containing protein [Streptomyces]|uniref:DUF4235 domain-containing protein n=1 Tax=Streptomyces TaxID=1883 RepID=UPI0004C81072|nr:MULTISPECIES: DUF4235 domain-containing protein [Streptomyces]NDZ64608.1 DUF4235 domain-containing protein [Streptomyces cyaneofuscatus]ONI49170.1 hypothetical protein STIB_67290 [Streptomyces sp. IB2014 011-1]RDV47648.1 DUF4235 domain-containing protein [Streptomyces sp. IB2014 011-12]CAD5922854.1 conserved protein of unknown function [Streptomyces sp. KY75]CAD5990824.1 conserved protein of unknown function [Streptomyces sp. KY70]